MGDTVQIVEVGPRDGLQAESVTFSVEDRAEMVVRLAESGLTRIEAVSFVHPDRVPQMAHAEAVLDAVRSSNRAGSADLIGLVLNARGLQRALDAGVDEVNLAVAATDGFARANQGRPVEEVVAECVELVAQARAAGLPTSVTVSASFGCPYEGEVSVARLVAVVAALVDGAPPDELALADSIGVAVPADVVERLDAVAEVVGPAPVRLRCHFHDTRNTAIANVVAAQQWGVRTFDSSIGGLGGCPFAPGATGNLATEDLVYLLDRSGVSSGIDASGLVELAPWLEERLGHTLPSAVARAGGFPAARTTS